jgi:hypothetical protein
MDTGQEAPNPQTGADENRVQPPPWLKASDESWGPTDLRKHPPTTFAPQSGLKLPVLPRLPRRTRPFRFIQGKPSFKGSALPMLIAFGGIILPCSLAGLWLEHIMGFDSLLVYMLGFFVAILAEFFAIFGVLWMIKALRGR